MPDAPKLVPTRTAHKGPTKNRKARGYGTNWQKVRLLVLAEEPLCSFCSNAFSTQVHHKDHNTANNARENLTGCCASCHAKYHAQKRTQ